MSKHSGTSNFALLVVLCVSMMKKQSVSSDRQNPWLLDAGRERKLPCRLAVNLT